MPDKSYFKNQILSRLPRADFALLRPELERVELPLRLCLEAPSKPIKHVYFPESGIASVVAKGHRGLEIEAGIIGCEGMTGLSILMNDDRSPHATYMQVAGHGWRLRTDEFRSALAESGTMHHALLLFAQAFMTQTAHTALANGRATLAERLARWLLMAQDRIQGNMLPLTQEFLSVMLGVRRAGVTAALTALKRNGTIEAKRGVIVVLNRRKLEKAANGLYGICEREYQRLLGWPGNGPSHRQSLKLA